MTEWPETLPLTDEELRRRWEAIVADSSFQELAYKVETDAYGNVLMSPHAEKHSARQALLMRALNALAQDQHLDGEAVPEHPVRTDQGVKQIDVAWLSREAFRESLQSDQASRRQAPPLCIEVMSREDTFEKLYEKRQAYFSIGAEEVWLVTRPGRILFFHRDAPEETAASSALFTNFPDHLDALTG